MWLKPRSGFKCMQKICLINFSIDKKKGAKTTVKKSDAKMEKAMNSKQTKGIKDVKIT